MSWLGKVIGGAFGFFMGGPLGAVLGAAVGHRYDQERSEAGGFRHEVDSSEQYRMQTVFFTAAFSVMGHVAKIDGRVTEVEIEQARAIMTRLGLNEDMRATAARLFTEGKRADFPLDEALDQFRAECRNRFSLTRMFVEMQLEVALADGFLHPAEEKLLLRICERLRFSRFEFHALKAALEAQLRLGGQWGRGGRVQTATREPSLEEAYATLGVKSSSGDDEIRRAYRRLLSRHHPDKMTAKGMSEEAVRQANEKTGQIRKAWEIVRGARGM